MFKNDPSSKSFLPAAGRHWALPLYDPFVRLIGGDHVRRLLLDQARLHAGLAVLDVGCGTGSLAVALKAWQPDVEVTALDPDPDALARARAKAQAGKLHIRFDSGYADALPYADASFDRVLSSFMFHHLPKADKAKMLHEVRRVLKPGGSLHLLDFAAADAGERVLARLREAGFPEPRRVAGGSLLFGLMPYASFEARTPLDRLND